MNPDVLGAEAFYQVQYFAHDSTWRPVRSSLGRVHSLGAARWFVENEGATTLSRPPLRIVLELTTKVVVD